jgi:hypothetical protein
MMFVIFFWNCQSECPSTYHAYNWFLAHNNFGKSSSQKKEKIIDKYVLSKLLKIEKYWVIITYFYGFLQIISVPSYNDKFYGSRLPSS